MNENIEDLKIYELFIRTRQCLMNCKQEGFENIHMYSNVSDAIVLNMQTRKPYEYLHLCYFQMYALPKAASASYTFLVGHPEDPAMKKNLDYYTQQPEVDINNVVDLESEDYQILYRLGLKSYKLKNWGETIANMEETLVDYLAWENKCRMECEQQPEQEWSPEVTIVISNYIASLLTCKQRCQDQLKPLYNSGTDFLADLLNYLQISYYNLDRLDDVGKAVASYLTLLPEDEDMLENKKIYQTLIDEDSFLERSDIIHYLKRDKYEKQLLEFFHQDNSDKLESNLVF
ncbi:cartilage-associated protein-like [Colias croceus]|uniref:cartilage-associated protein-like n=1 Tax=Colias crocea TaxID=72248 RepID=UPI001E27A269|nr:cartilage-associated protein-like [Colias croceus]XP_045495684.1 cartilage-associated protein-like [Colias croceus]